jgi:acetyl-CoA acetyltransferase
MSDAYIIGSFSSPFGRWIDKDHRALARDAVSGVLEDAGLADGSGLGQAYFGSCLMPSLPALTPNLRAPTSDHVADSIADASAEDGSTPFEPFRPTTSQGRFELR